MKSLILGLVGKSGSGKSTVSLYLKTKGFYPVELSGFITRIAQKEHLQISKTTLQTLGNELREKDGPEILAKLALEEITRHNSRLSVIAGIRNIHEINHLCAQKNFYLLGIVTSDKLRYNRIIKAKGPKWVGSYKNFLTIEKRDSNLGNKKTGLRVSECLQMANFTIKNDKMKTDLYQKIDDLVNSL